MVTILIKIFIISFSILFLNNCSAPGTAFLGPTVTGIKTGSIYQASISYGSNEIVNTVKTSINERSNNTKELKFLSEKQNDDIQSSSLTLTKLLPITTYAIETSEIIEPEPLP